MLVSHLPERVDSMKSNVPTLTNVTTGGHCLTGLEEQQAAISYLQEVEKNMGWHVQHIVDHLQEQWQRS